MEGCVIQLISLDLRGNSATDWLCNIQKDFNLFLWESDLSHMKKGN